MARGSFGIKGTGPLIKAMQKKYDLSAVKKVVMQNGSEMQRRMQREASFKGHYHNGKFIPPTGTTKRSIGISSPMGDRGFSVMVSPNTHYSSYLEYGTRYMAAQPFVQPAFLAQKMQFIRDLERLLK